MAALEKPVFVWEYIGADELFTKMKKERLNMVIVLDEYGGVSGLLTLNDLIAELIGNFNEEDGLIFNEDGSCLVNGFTKIEKINKSFKTSIDEKYQTLNGLVYAMLDGGKKGIVSTGLDQL